MIPREYVSLANINFLTNQALFEKAIKLHPRNYKQSNRAKEEIIAMGAMVISVVPCPGTCSNTHYHHISREAMSMF